MIYLCCNEHRREAVQHQRRVNGIDFLELSEDPALPPDQRRCTLVVHFIHPLKMNALNKDNLCITGSERIRDVSVVDVAMGESPRVLIVRVNKPGDYSTYTLHLPPPVDGQVPDFDPLLSEVNFSFKTTDSKNVDFDCDTEEVCFPQPIPTPEIDYLARDYASFRQLMLDRLTVLLPQRNEQRASDLGVMLVEILAYVADYLSYQQDVIATESYLGTARRRVSVRRHARMLDYAVSEGCNARAWVQVQVNQDIKKQPNDKDAPTQLLTQVPGQKQVSLSKESTAYIQALHTQEVFETMDPLYELYVEHNEMHFYTWGARECCLPKGATHATLQGSLKNLKKGDVLIFKEVYGAHTGRTEDAEPTHRHAVRLTSVKPGKDPLGAWFTPPVEGKPLPTVLVEEVGLHIREEDRVKTKVTVTEVEEGKLIEQVHTTEETHVEKETRTVEDLYLVEDKVEVEDTRVEEDKVVGEDELQETREIFDMETAGLPPLQLSEQEETGEHAREEGKATDEEEGKIVSEEHMVRLEEERTQEEQQVIDEDGGEEEEETVERTHTVEEEHALEEQRVVREDQVVEAERIIETTLTVEKERTQEEQQVVETERIIETTRTVEREDTLREEPDYSVDITEIEWDVEDALPFPLCISAITGYEHNHTYIENISVALGNIVLADHGRTVDKQQFDPVPESTPRWAYATNYDRCKDRPTRQVFPRFYPSLQYGPLTHAVPYDESKDISASAVMRYIPHHAVPAITLTITEKDKVKQAPTGAGATNQAGTRQVKPDLLTGGRVDTYFVVKQAPTGAGATNQTREWQVKRDLLASVPVDTHFVVEVEGDGSASLRFGDDQHGLRPRGGTSFSATYRVGNGVCGNVGAEALYHIVSDDTRIAGVSNPLPASGGVDPQSIEDIRQKVSRAFSTQHRGVTPEDYKEIVERDFETEVRRARAVLRWTGSWYTVLLVVERRGGMPVDGSFKENLRKRLERYRMVGSDLVIVSPVYVPLEIDMTVSVKPNYFHNSVKTALQEAFSNRCFPDGRRGIFHSDKWEFGQPVYRNALNAAANDVAGVESVEITTFRRQGIADSGDDGVIKLDWLELVRLENDPNNPERGIFRLEVKDT